MKIIQSATGSGTCEYAVDPGGRLLARGYGEMHGWTPMGEARCHVVQGRWRVVSSAEHDWARLATLASLHAYEQALDRGLNHDDAIRTAISVAGW